MVITIILLVLFYPSHVLVSNKKFYKLEDRKTRVMFQLECFCRSSAFLALRTSQHQGHSALAHLVLPESCLDKSGGFIQLSLLMVSQCELGEFVLDLLTGGRAQELRPVRCRWKAGFLERYFTDRGAFRAQAGIRRGGERLIICTSETRGDTGQAGDQSV